MGTRDMDMARLEPALVQHLLQDLKVGYAVADGQLRVTEVGGDVSVLGAEAAAWRGRLLPDLVPELAGDEAVLTDILSGALPRLELVWINRTSPDGHTYYLTTVDLPHRDAHGQIMGLFHLVQDSTEAGILHQQLTQHRNELRLAQANLTNQNLDLAAVNAELRRLDELKTTFVSMAAHELRTPLATIQGFAEMLVDEDIGPLSRMQREYLGIIHDSAQRLLHLATNMLDVTCIEAQRLVLLPQPTDLVAVVNKAIAEFRAQAMDRRQHMTLNAAPGLPPALCDPNRAIQVIGNLLSNAVKYTQPEGHILVAVEPAAEEGFLQLSVADDGVGIAADDQDQVFKRFFRAASAAEAQAGGAGLGLYITHALVELHGGRIWFSSEQGQGSTFYVTFPIAV